MSSIDPPMTIPDLIAELDVLARDEACALAFDGDGTLWAGDVSDDVFLAACNVAWLRDALEPAVGQLLERYDLPRKNTVSEAAICLFEAEKSGTFPERELFEFMTWCYAGRSAAELTLFAESVLQAAGIETRIRRAFLPLLDWAKSRGHTAYLVTASPWPIVSVPARRLGFEEHRMVAARAIEDNCGNIGPDVVARVPYGPEKPIQLRARCPNRRLLAAFGDSHFDVDLLRAAELPVAVNPKPFLQRQLDSIHRVVVLEL